MFHVPSALYTLGLLLPGDRAESGENQRLANIYTLKNSIYSCLAITLISTIGVCYFSNDPWLQNSSLVLGTIGLFGAGVSGYLFFKAASSLRVY